MSAVWFEFDGAEGIAFWVSEDDTFEKNIRVMFDDLDKLKAFLKENLPGFFSEERSVGGSMTERDWDNEGNLRAVLAEFDVDTPDDEGPYLVQKWVYRLGFHDVRRFPTEEEARAYALKKAYKHNMRYRVLGKVEEEA